jgi:hypothetical protein
MPDHLNIQLAFRALTNLPPYLTRVRLMSSVYRIAETVELEQILTLSV